MNKFFRIGKLYFFNEYLYFHGLNLYIMKDLVLLEKEINSEVNPSIILKCPYCKISTVVNRLLTQPACKHFEDFTLFENDG